MYFSRLVLNRQSRTVCRDLANAYQMHRTVMSAFPQLTTHCRYDPESGQILWRVDHDPRSELTLLIVQSALPPDWNSMLERQPKYVAAPLGSDLPPVDTKQCELNFAPGQLLTFRLRANPTRKVKVEGRKNGRRLGLIDEADQRAWLERKVHDIRQPSGFRLRSLVVTPESPPRPSPEEKVEEHDLAVAIAATTTVAPPITHLAVRFDGVLQVVNPAALLATMQRGIGSAKGFGFGLLSLAKG